MANEIWKFLARPMYTIGLMRVWVASWLVACFLLGWFVGDAVALLVAAYLGLASALALHAGLS